MKRLYLLCLLLSITFLSLSAAQDIDVTPLTADLAQLLPNDKAGTVIGFINGDEETIFVLGNSSFDETTLFEYGSLTKVFSTIMLQQLADEGVMNLDDSVSQYLAPELNAEQWQTVKLRHLATHTAGIPDLPPNLNPLVVWILGRNNDPFARYDEARLYEGIKTARIKGTGETWKYSNFGFALLGQLLKNATGQSYDNLIQTRILQPLAMQTASTTTFSSANVAPPLKANGNASNHMFFNAIASAGALKGSMTDAMKFLKAALQACMQEDAISAAICESTQASYIKINETETQSLGWLRSQQSNHDIIWHNGGTRGHRSFLGFVPATNRGLVILMNVADVDITEPALTFLNSF